MPTMITRGAASAQGFNPLQKLAPPPPYSLLMHFDGANGSQDFIDDSGAIITRSGAVEISTTASKFGGSSGFFNGGFLLTPSTPALTFGTGDITIDFWVNPTSLTGLQEILTKGAGIQIYLSGANLTLALSSNNSVVYFISAALGTLQAGVWQHLAFVKQGTLYSFYVNGVSRYSSNQASVIDSGTGPLVIGNYNGANYMYYGYMDELRIAKQALFSGASFPVPTAPY